MEVKHNSCGCVSVSWYKTNWPSVSAAPKISFSCNWWWHHFRSKIAGPWVVLKRLKSLGQFWLSWNLYRAIFPILVCGPAFWKGNNSHLHWISSLISSLAFGCFLWSYYNSLIFRAVINLRIWVFHDLDFLWMWYGSPWYKRLMIN